MPRISGYIHITDRAIAHADDMGGCFYSSYTSNTWCVWKNETLNTGALDFVLDSGRCSDVYGASDTVTPSSLTSQFIIKC